MTYQEIVNTPVAELTGISYEKFVDLLSACMVEILRTEGKAKEDMPFEVRHELAERYQKLNETYNTLKCHEHFKTYDKHLSSIRFGSLNFQAAA